MFKILPSVLELKLDQYIWPIFSTKDWENFALKLYNACMKNDDKAKRVLDTWTKCGNGKDGRERWIIELPCVLKTIACMNIWEKLQFPHQIRRGQIYAPRFLENILKKLSDEGKTSFSWIIFSFGIN